MDFIEKQIESLIENTTMIGCFKGDALSSYRIKPNEGFVLHDKMRDVEELDERDVPTGEIIRGYTSIECGCAADYDFGNVKEINGRTAYGVREFFARLASEISTEGGEHDV